jgi:hypothetical protein
VAGSWLGAAVLALCLGACGSLQVGQAADPARTQSPWVVVREGRADVNGDGSALSIETPDWTYGGSFGFMWIDAAGTTHDRDAPDCLPPGASRMVRFAATEVTVDGRTWRPIVLVDCR